MTSFHRQEEKVFDLTEIVAPIWPPQDAAKDDRFLAPPRELEDALFALLF
jgi:hypothetical protein